MAWPMIAAAAASAIASAYSAHKKNQAAKSDANLYNDWLKQYMDTGKGLFNQAQASGWNPFGPKTSTSSMTGGSSTSFSNRPFITQEYAPLDELMRGIMQGRLSGGSSLPQGYASNAARAINESFAGADTAARNLAARRGLSGEQSYAVASPVARARAGALADMRGNLPLLERQMQNEDLGITSGLQSAFGTGQRGTSNTNQWSQGSQTNPFNAGDLSALMSILAPPSPQQSGQTGNSAFASGLGGLGSILGYYASQNSMGQQPNAQKPNAQMQNLWNNNPGFMFNG